MIFMNDYDIARIVAAAPSDLPNLTSAACTLYNLACWANENSDGWAFWPKPARAAAKLQTLLTDWEKDNRVRQQNYGTNLPDITDAQLKAALTPIKAFLTRQGVSHQTVVWELDD